MTLHKITEFYTEWFSVCINITSTILTIAILISFVKQNEEVDRHFRGAYYLQHRGALMMEAVRTSETSVYINLTTRLYISEDSKVSLPCVLIILIYVNILFKTR
jgi:hypothetical protein